MVSALAAFNISYDDNQSDQILMDSGATVHVFHDKTRFIGLYDSRTNERLKCGGGLVAIQGWGTIRLALTKGRILSLHRVAYISSFPINLVSLSKLESQGIDWEHRTGKMNCRRTSKIVGYTERQKDNYRLLENVRPTSSESAFSTSSDNSIVRIHESLASADVWHRRMGHIGPLCLYKLGQECLGVRLRGRTMSQCTHCALSKITQQISRRTPINHPTRPFYKINIDWNDLEEGWDDYDGTGMRVRRVMGMTCEATGMAITYYTESAKEDENLPLIQDFITWVALRYNLEIKVIHTDNEMNRVKTQAYLRDVGIAFESCAPDTHAQNGVAERFGRTIMEKARAMRLSANLPHRLWREIMGAATYLYNRTPKASLGWKSPYEAFHTYVWNKEGVVGPRKPLLRHLRAYGCKCFVLIKSRGDPNYRNKLRKLNSKAHIGFLVGYESTNIYRVWIPHKFKVISVRDVIFNEEEVWDGNRIQFTPVDIKELDEAIEIVQVPRSEEAEDILIGEEEEVLGARRIPTESNAVPEQTSSEAYDEEAEKQAQLDDIDWMENQYPTPDESVAEAFLARTIQIPMATAPRPLNVPAEAEGVEFGDDLLIEPSIIDSLAKRQSDQHYEYVPRIIPTKMHLAFNAG